MDFILKKSDRRSVALEISPDGTLIVRAPKNYTEKEARDFIIKNEKWILKHLPSILEKDKEISSLSDNDILLAKKGAKMLFSFLVEKYAPTMGVCPKSIKITSAKKRFGSCSTKDGICFSYFLMLYPIEAITYVVVHELAHIEHHNHSADFHNYVKAHLPEADKYEKLLHPSFAKYENFKKNIELADNIVSKKIEHCFLFS